MAFDDLTPDQIQTLIPLIEALDSGSYTNEFIWLRRAGEQSGFIHLYGKNGVSDHEISGFTNTDLETLKQEGYIITSARMTALKAKAFQQYKQHKDSLEQLSAEAEPMEIQNPSIDIFISHSSQDIRVAEALIKLLRNALNISAERIRCTSVPGHTLEPGASVEETLRREVKESTAFIGLITPASLESTYVLFELGARWIVNRHLVPVLASGADASILKDPLKGRNVVRCDTPEDIRDLIENLAKVLNLSPVKASAYESDIKILTQRSKPRKKRASRKDRVAAVNPKSSTVAGNEQLELSPEECDLLIAAAESGEIFLHSFDQGKWITAGSRKFPEDESPVSVAKYVYALKSLCGRGLAEYDDGDLYLLTNPGFEAAGKLKQREKSTVPMPSSEAADKNINQTTNQAASLISNDAYPRSLTPQVATQWSREFLTPVIDLLGEIKQKFNQNAFTVERLSLEPHSTAYRYRINFFQRERWDGRLTSDVGEYFLMEFPQIKDVLVSFEKSMDGFEQALSKLEKSIADSPLFLSQLKVIYWRLIVNERIPRSDFENLKLQEMSQRLLGQMHFQISHHLIEGEESLIRFTAYTLLELDINFKPHALTEDLQLFHFCKGDISNELRGKDEAISRAVEETMQLFDVIRSESSTLHQQLKREKFEIMRRYDAPL